jgi:hypothetical protein
MLNFIAQIEKYTVVFRLSTQLEPRSFVRILPVGVYFRRSIPKSPHFIAMSKKLIDKRLNESQRCEIISKLSKMNLPSKRALARGYDVRVGAIRKVWEKRDSIIERSALLSKEAKQKTFKASVGQFTELEDMLYIWIDNMRRARLPVSPSLAIAKAKNIASTLSISDLDFKASWQWLNRFRARQGLQKMLLHGEGAEVDKNDP